ncbi:hypothetical protein [Fredinandcohnia sp. FSL W7-1320]|uniref:hypothetical protein n=1 Tax=Fredinandcohnia sp. FSL W7-1320 TaxID=2954540 RepID=UPI0030FD8643
MSVIGTLILPIIILFILAIILVSVFFGKKFKGVKGTKILLGTYLIILTVSVIVYYCIPSFKTSENTTQDLSYEQINQAIQQGNIENFEAIKEKEKWEIPFDQDQLNIKPLDNLNMHTVFDRNETDNNIIEVIYYVANTNFNGYDFYEEIPSPTVSIENNNMLVISPLDYSIRLYSFHNDFVISQFKGGGIMDEFDNRFNDDKPLNYDFLLIRVPKNLELTGSEFINFIGE